MSNNSISPQEVLGIRPGDTDIDIIRKYKKKLKIAQTEYEKEVLFDSYQACISQAIPKAFDTSNIKSQEQLKNFNQQIENDHDLQSSLFGKKKQVNLFNQNTFLTEEQMNKTRQEFGQGNSMNTAKFNSFFDNLYSNQNKQPTDYNNLKNYDINDEFTSQFQNVASHSGTIMHMGEFTHDDFLVKQNKKRQFADFNDETFSRKRLAHDQEYKPISVKYNDTGIINETQMVQQQREEMLNQAEINKAFIAMNAQRMGRQVHLDDRDNDNRINGVINGRLNKNI